MTNNRISKLFTLLLLIAVPLQAMEKENTEKKAKAKTTDQRSWAERHPKLTCLAFAAAIFGGAHLLSETPKPETCTFYNPTNRLTFTAVNSLDCPRYRADANLFEVNGLRTIDDSPDDDLWMRRIERDYK